MATTTSASAGVALLEAIRVALPAMRLLDDAVDREAYRNDRRRGNALLAAGFRVARFSWEDVHLGPDAVVASVRALLARG